MFYPFSVWRIPDRQSTTYWIDGVAEYAPLSSSVVISDDECNHNWLVIMERRCMSRVSFERADNRDGSDLGWGSFWGSNPQAQACAACREIALTGCSPLENENDGAGNNLVGVRDSVGCRFFDDESDSNAGGRKIGAGDYCVPHGYEHRLIGA